VLAYDIYDYLKLMIVSVQDHDDIVIVPTRSTVNYTIDFPSITALSSSKGSLLWVRNF